MAAVCAGAVDGVGVAFIGVAVCGEGIVDIRFRFCHLKEERLSRAKSACSSSYWLFVFSRFYQIDLEDLLKIDPQVGILMMRMNIVGRESSLPTYGQMYEAFQEPLLREWKVSHMPFSPPPLHGATSSRSRRAPACGLFDFPRRSPPAAAAKLLALPYSLSSNRSLAH
nr:hypothetical protein Iba_chr09aCG12820 [Ipomoea batatas]